MVSTAHTQTLPTPMSLTNPLIPRKAYSINIGSFKTICRKVRLSMRNFKPLRLLLDNLSLNFSKTIGEKHNELMNSNKSP